jgi:four helix bundle protein
MTREELSDRLWDFAARVGKVVDALPDTRVGRHVAGQLVRCGTSAPPNYDEGCNAESRADFIHKLKVALKELAETRGWLCYIPKAELLPKEKLAPLVSECKQLCCILGRSVNTAKYPDPGDSTDTLNEEPFPADLPLPGRTMTNDQLPITNDKLSADEEVDDKG